MDIFTSTFSQVRAFAEHHEGAIVAFSGGKDSLVCLDMACRAFRRVVAVHGYFVPGMRFAEERVEAASARWGVPVLQYPDPQLVRLLNSDLYRDRPAGKADRLPEWSFGDIYDLARKETGISLVVTGVKYSDAMGQGLAHAKKDKAEGRVGRPTEDTLRPLARWNKWHVLAYLKTRDIPVPDSDGRNSGSYDCTPDFICWLHDSHPDDFEVYCRVFPYAPAVVARRDWYGIGPARKR